VVPVRLPPVPISAPGLEGARLVPTSPVSGPRSSRRSRNRPYSHVHLEIDLGPFPGGKIELPELAPLEQSLSEEKDAPAADLARRIAGALHALAARRFRRIDHWEVSPGGWLPPPGRTTHNDSEEPVGHLLEALGNGSLGSLAAVRSFAARLSDLHGGHVDLVVRRDGRLHRHNMSLDLWGLWTQAEVDRLSGSLASRLPVVHSEMTKYQYA
jgi:hypothetical protein